MRVSFLHGHEASWNSRGEDFIAGFNYFILMISSDGSFVHMDEAFDAVIKILRMHLSILIS